MNRPVDIAQRPQVALQSYLDGLLHEATEAFEALDLDAGLDRLDEFQAAVLEEQVRDAVSPQPVPVPVPAPAPAPPVQLPSTVADPIPPASLALVAPVVDVHLPSATPQPLSAAVDGRPSWAAEPFECLLFDVAGLTLAVPLVCLGSIYALAGQTLTPLFGQPDWFLGILPSNSGNLKVLDTARWVMPDRYRDDFRQGLQYVISVQGYEWGLAVHQVSRSLRLDPNEIKWRSQRGQRPWLAGTVIEHMCALLDVAELAELIASGGARHLRPVASAPGKPVATTTAIIKN
ncbi:CheW domain-containing protein [Pseudomonas sp. CFBP 8770]|uniref:CheW domain-containing protein n=1 Tax=unclassified Pseudomonas TaxID=196821 RepID=UPI00177DC0BE|nr:MULTISPECIES: CheW domain-containing protein [unclassified Pseudomonas]MBD8473615.1 CheW domain-containing protein [Pseudomonas sp. CFBP 8773]MBD8646742.1 CheW domain-containing protein [Pseudomonas sp. CFBP 8770]